MDKGSEEVPRLETGPLDLADVPSVIAVELYCPKCTGPMIKCRVGYVGIYGWWLDRVSRQTGALGPPRAATSEVVAQVCTRCGFTELYARDPAALAESGEKH